MGQEFGLVASGTWETLRSNQNSRIAFYQDSITGASLIFKFNKNGNIKIFNDDNGNGRINRRTDELIGNAKYDRNFDKQFYRRRRFFNLNEGEFEIEVEGFTNELGEYEAFYSIRLDSGIDRESDFGTFDVSKFVNVQNNSLLTELFQPGVTSI